MTTSFDHASIDAKWQRRWAEEGAFQTPANRDKPKYYVLDMFPYPSGEGLHVGHPKGYVATDVLARAKRMQGYNVLHPMGWDAFGLPAERQAVREGRHPREITARNIRTFKGQLQRLGLSYDWSRELATSDPAYYKWTQWIFVKLYERGLAYRAEVPVNWCPALGTVLANEEVKEGVYVETGDPVEQRVMTQWMLRITDYAERLLEGLDDLDWPDGIKAQQREWIGKSMGADVVFDVAGLGEPIEVFTTRPDTLFGATYLVLAPEHELASRITTEGRRREVQRYIVDAQKRSERERAAEAAATKSGVFTGAYAVNPVNEAEIPIWVADYVLASYGKGAIFACPAHDERDHAFAKHFGLPIVEVVAGGNVEEAAYPGDGPHVRSEFLDGLHNEEAIERVTAWLEARGRGRRAVRYKLRDWLFSRQRYWGEPFPMLELEDGSLKALAMSELPVELPDLEALTPTPDGRPPLARARQWVETADPETGAPARRETNTMPQWAGSCWYYLRFITPWLEERAWDPEAERYWMPVDLYLGGAEHAVLHLLYARFWHQVLYDLGLVSTPEPFRRLFNQGLIHAIAYRDESGKWHAPEDVEEREGAFYVRGTCKRVTASREKMSKSRYNVVNPDELCACYGADALRLYELFLGPLEEGNDWDTGGVLGTRRFLDRVWRLQSKLTDEAMEAPALERALNAAIRKVSESLESLRFNTAIAEMMAFVNEATKAEQVPRPWFEVFVRVLAPFAPHVCEEMWQALGHDGLVMFASWPEWDEAKLQVDSITLAVQVSGKLRATIEVPADVSRERAIAAAKADANVARHLEDRAIRREVYVPGRLVNLVVG